MKLIKTLSVAMSLALITACASTSDYHAAKGSNSSGYFETPIEANRYRVSYRLKRKDVAGAQELALRRAAELTLEKGYDTFEIVSQSTDSETEREDYRAIATNDTMVQRNCGLLGCTTSITRVPNDPFHEDSGPVRSESTVTLEILMSNKDANVSPSLYDASEVYANLSR